MVWLPYPIASSERCRVYLSTVNIEWKIYPKIKIAFFIIHVYMVQLYDYLALKAFLNYLADFFIFFIELHNCPEFLNYRFLYVTHK